MNFVKPITSDHDLLELAKRMNVCIDDIMETSEITKPIPKKGSFLILLRPKGTDVRHWVSCVDGHYFDSMGEGPPKRLGKLQYNETQYQDTYGFYCGIWSLLFMYCRQHNKMDLLKRFHDLNFRVFY